MIMRIAILTDIHANREAMEAVLEAVAELAPDRLALLGDIVGYGPDPVYAVERVAGLVANGALCILGNHDEAALLARAGMTPNAEEAMRWTRRQLGADHLSFLAGLKLTAEIEDALLVHASASNPGKWPYLNDSDAAARCLAACAAKLVFCGHTHVPAIYYGRAGRKPVHFAPLPNRAAPLSALHRHVVVVGSVGQPRDGNPAACFALLDTKAATVTMQRVPYDTRETHRKIAAAGLPDWLGLRLHIGR